jgi:hypothetical protein
MFFCTASLSLTESLKYKAKKTPAQKQIEKRAIGQTKMPKKLLRAHKTSEKNRAHLNLVIIESAIKSAVSGVLFIPVFLTFKSE